MCVDTHFKKQAKAYRIDNEKASSNCILDLQHTYMYTCTFTCYCTLSSNEPPQQCANASQTLCDMIRLSREAAQMAGPTPLLSTLERCVHIVQLMRPDIGRNAPCALGDCLKSTCRCKGLGSCGSQFIVYVCGAL